MTTATDKKTMTMAGLIFNANGEVLVDKNQQIPMVSVDAESTPEEKMSKLVESINEFAGVKSGLGDVVYDNYAANGEEMLVFLSFLEDYDNIKDGVSWMPLSDISTEDQENFMYILHIHLIQTLFNTQKMRMGNCYENVATGETYYVIHVINDNMRNKNFLVLESTMGSEPLILPSDAFWGLPMKWVSHLRFMEMVQYMPETLADRAKYFFIHAHNMTNHRYDGKPYSFHLAGVVEQHHKFKHLIPIEDQDRVEAELYGHDAIEDARLTFNDVKEVLGQDVAEGCYALTNNKGRNRKERADDTYYNGISEDPYGEYKKLCDRLANVEYSKSNGSSMYTKYKKEYANFESLLRTHGDLYAEMWDTLNNL